MIKPKPRKTYEVGFIHPKDCAKYVYFQSRKKAEAFCKRMYKANLYTTEIRCFVDDAEVMRLSALGYFYDHDTSTLVEDKDYARFLAYVHAITGGGKRLFIPVDYRHIRSSDDLFKYKQRYKEGL